MMTSNRRLRRPPWSRRQSVQEQPGSTEPPKAVSQATPRVLRTQIIPFWLIQNLYVFFILCFTIGLFLFTMIGSIGVFGLDLLRVVDPAYWQSATWTWLWIIPMNPVLAAAIGGGWQIIDQIGQFATAHDNPTAYRRWLAGSVIPSTITYLIFISRWMTWEIWGPLLPFAWLVAFVVVAGLSLAADIAQERILVRR